MKIKPLDCYGDEIPASQEDLEEIVGYLKRNWGGRN
jgi:hypothetical protein